MLRARGGSIINIASVAALIGLRGSIPYQASKAAVLGLTRGAAISYVALPIDGGMVIA